MLDEESVVRSFSEHLKSLRRQKNLTQERLAELADISYKNLQYLEDKNPTCPSLITLYKLSRGLNIPLPQILDFAKRKKQ